MKLSTYLALATICAVGSLLSGCTTVPAPKLVMELPLSRTPKPITKLIVVVNPGVGYKTQYPHDMEILSTLKEKISTEFLAKSIPVEFLDASPYKVVELFPSPATQSALDLAIADKQPTHILRMTVVKATIQNNSFAIGVTWRIEVLQASSAAEKSIKNFSPITEFSLEGSSCSMGLVRFQCASKLASEMISVLQRKGFFSP